MTSGRSARTRRISRTGSDGGERAAAALPPAAPRRSGWARPPRVHRLVASGGLHHGDLHAGGRGAPPPRPSAWATPAAAPRPRAAAGSRIRSPAPLARAPPVVLSFGRTALFPRAHADRPPRSPSTRWTCRRTRRTRRFAQARARGHAALALAGAPRPALARRPRRRSSAPRRRCSPGARPCWTRRGGWRGGAGDRRVPRRHRAAAGVLDGARRPGGGRGRRPPWRCTWRTAAPGRSGWRGCWTTALAALAARRRGVHRRQGDGTPPAPLFPEPGTRPMGGRGPRRRPPP